MGTLHPSLIVGIGGSAGALNAYKALLEALPAKTGMAFVIISHLSPSAHSYLANILSRYTKMKVMVASMAMPISANHVYVIPSDSDLLIENYTFKVISPRSVRNKQVDLFFISLAEAMGARAIGIILSGYDGDGTEGCRHIQAHGGKTFAQDSSAEVDSMPRSVQAAGFANFVIPLDQISGILKSLAELVIANEEKAKREAELVIANEEKEKRAAELIVVQKDVKDLEVLNTHKESVLATLSHDLRSPLGNIIGIADYLKSDFDNMEPSEVKELINVLLKASTEELNMLDYLVEWARIKYASEAFTPSKIRLGEYVEKVLNVLNKNASANNIQIDNEIGNGIFVFADDKMLLCILQNIVSNSIKHTPSGGKVTISAKRSEDKIIVDIKDTGIGMSKEMQENLFTPQMKKLSKARKENKGAGIGLLLVKGFIEKHGGKIWVESEVGRGSDFKFTIPTFNGQAL
jgi:signal transduction histidine kinase